MRFDARDRDPVKRVLIRLLDLLLTQTRQRLRLVPPPTGVATH